MQSDVIPDVARDRDVIAFNIREAILLYEKYQDSPDPVVGELRAALVQLAELVAPKPDPDDAALCETLRYNGDPIRRIQNDHVPVKKAMRKAADRLESLSRQLSDAKDADIAEICTGCGSMRTIAEIKASNPKALSCCPERKMIKVRDLWRQEYEAQRERDDLRAAVSAARAELGALDTYCATDDEFPGYSQGLSEVYVILDRHLPAEHTEGGKP